MDGMKEGWKVENDSQGRKGGMKENAEQKKERKEQQLRGGLDKDGRKEKNQ